MSTLYWSWYHAEKTGILLLDRPLPTEISVWQSSPEEPRCWLLGWSAPDRSVVLFDADNDEPMKVSAFSGDVALGSVVLEPALAASPTEAHDSLACPGVWSKAMVQAIVPSDQAGWVSAKEEVIRPTDVGTDGVVKAALLDADWACVPQVQVAFGTAAAIGPVSPFEVPSGPPGLQVTFSYRVDPGKDPYSGMVEVHLAWRGLPEEVCTVALAAQEVHQRSHISRQLRRDELGPGHLDVSWRLRSQREALWDDHLFVVVAEGTAVDARLLDRDGTVASLAGPYCYFTGQELRPAPGFAKIFAALCAAHPVRRPARPPVLPMADTARQLAGHPGLARWIQRGPVSAILDSETAVAGLATLPTGLAYAVVSSLAQARLEPHNLMRKALAAVAWPASVMLVAGAVTPDPALRAELNTSLDAALAAEGLSAGDRRWLRARPAAQELCRLAAERGLGAMRTLSLARIIDRPPSPDELPRLLDALDAVADGIWLEEDVLPQASLGGHPVATLLADRRAVLTGPVTAAALQALPHKLRLALADLAAHLNRLVSSRPQVEPYLTRFSNAARLLADGRTCEGFSQLKGIAAQPSQRVPLQTPAGLVDRLTAAGLVDSLRQTMEAGLPPVASADEHTLDSLARGFAEYVVDMAEVATGLDSQLALLSGERSSSGTQSDWLGRLTSLARSIESHLAVLKSRPPLLPSYNPLLSAAIAPDVAKYEKELKEASQRLEAVPTVCSSLQDQDATVAAILPHVDAIRAAIRWLRANRRLVAAHRLAAQLERRWEAVMARLGSLREHVAVLFDSEVRTRLEQSRVIGVGDDQLAGRAKDIEAAEDRLVLLERLTEALSRLAEPDRTRLLPSLESGSLLEARARQLYDERMSEHIRAQQEEQRYQLLLSILARRPPPPHNGVTTGRPDDWIEQLKQLADGAAPPIEVELCRQQVRAALERIVRQWLPAARIDGVGMERLAVMFEAATEPEARAFVANGDRIAATLERLAGAVGVRTSTFLELPELIWLLGSPPAADHPMQLIGLLPASPLDPSSVLADPRLADTLIRKADRGFDALLQDLLPPTLANVTLNEVRNRLGGTLFKRVERARPMLLTIEGLALTSAALQNWMMAADLLKSCLTTARATDAPARIRRELARVLGEHNLVPPWLVLDAGLSGARDRGTREADIA